MWERLCKQSRHFHPLKVKMVSDLYCSCLKTGGWQKIVKSQQLSASDPDLPQLRQLWLRPWTWTRHAIVAATVSRWDFPCLHLVVQQTTLQLFFKIKFWEHVRALLVHCPRVKSFKGSGQIFFFFLSDTFINKGWGGFRAPCLTFSAKSDKKFRGRGGGGGGPRVQNFQKRFLAASLLS